MKQFLLLTFLFSSYAVIAQTKGGVEISGSTSENLRPLKDCLVTLYSDPSNDGPLVQKEQLVTSGSAKFKFTLKRDAIYLIECAKEGYVTKKVRVDTAVGLNAPETTVQFEFVVDMVPAKEGTAPVSEVNVYYDAARKGFDYRLN